MFVKINGVSDESYYVNPKHVAGIFPVSQETAKREAEDKLAKLRGNPMFGMLGETEQERMIQEVNEEVERLGSTKTFIKMACGDSFMSVDTIEDVISKLSSV